MTFRSDISPSCDLGVHQIIDRGLLRPVFQPIVDFRLRSILGFEALIRGPEHSPLHAPVDLFAAARAVGRMADLEHACRETSLRAFAGLRLPGRLFLNVTPGVLLTPQWMNGATQRLLAELGIAENRIVIELTENQQITDMPEMQAALQHFRGRGFQIAIDDLGEGFANLRMWSEVRPEFVKIDRHFIDGIADDHMKYHFVRAMQDLGESCNSSLVAEGVERREDFECVRDMGIACGQGFFIAHPAAQPAPTLTATVLGALAGNRVSLSPLASPSERTPVARDLLRRIRPAPHDASNEYVVSRFEADPSLDVLPVVDGMRPIGLINRHSMVDRFSRPFRRELFGRKSCQQFMDTAPLIVDQCASVQELAIMLAAAPKHYLFDGFIVTGDGAYLGVGSSHDLMAMITEMQIHAARHANPLTQLPGNVPINEHVDRMIEGDYPFVAAYIDIDNFKPFNDHFGYRRGDELILILAQQIRAAVDGRLDFVGHIGGDDFFVVFQSDDWLSRCEEIVSNFLAAVVATVGSGQAGAGYVAESRRGEPQMHPLPTLSVGVVQVAPGECDSHHEVAAAASIAKKHAKKEGKNNGGGAIFVERRRRFGTQRQEDSR
ncbi:MAG: GGDEF domain-containing protein [Flavobacteriales bacterium]|nr:MAG: GGDEF domain-containing protein [Flavobacteriales bacterium]